MKDFFCSLEKMNYIWLLRYQRLISNWLRIESESKCKLANRKRIQFVSIPSPKYCSIASVTLFRCHTWTQDFKGSILSIICFFFSRSVYQVHLTCPEGNAGTLPSPPRAGSRGSESGVVPETRVCLRLSDPGNTLQLLFLPQCMTHTHSTANFLMHRDKYAAKLEFFNTHTHTKKLATETHIYVLHTWAPVYAGNNLKAVHFNSVLNWLHGSPAASLAVMNPGLHSPCSINTCV